jgi:hypothetical protein
MKTVKTICKEIYEKSGATAVYDFINSWNKDNPKFAIPYSFCEPCNAETPHKDDECLICGQPTSITAKFCPEPIYFHVISSGWNGDLQRQEVEINCGDNGKIMIVKTDEGFVIDVYGQNDIVDTMAIWEDDLIGDDVEEESGAPENFSDVEIQEFKENWGQSHGEITSELGFPRSHTEADELILGTGNYFWDEKDKKWYNRCASLFTEREQAIADYLYLTNIE